ncbi:MAG: DUF1573 domain-containing protein [Bacteroidota bacterium]|nr:DUF1573 domain-containing protein [Bacteroidota bacterium]
MRYRLLHILIPLLVAATAQAQLRFDAMEKNFGDLRPLETRSLEFRVYNDGAEPVHIAKPRPSCGCTATILERAELASGDSTVIEVRFHASPGMIGTMTKTIGIGLLENGTERSVATLRIHARVVGDVVYEPGMLRFESVIGDTVRLVLTLRSNTAKAVRLENISAAMLAYVDTSAGNAYSVANVQARPFTAFRLALGDDLLHAGDSTELTLVMIPEEKGQINGSIRIPIPNSELRVPVSGVVLRTRAP